MAELNIWNATNGTLVPVRTDHKKRRKGQLKKLKVRGWGCNGLILRFQERGRKGGARRSERRAKCRAREERPSEGERRSERTDAGEAAKGGHDQGGKRARRKTKRGRDDRARHGWRERATERAPLAPTTLEQNSAVEAPPPHFHPHTAKLRSKSIALTLSRSAYGVFTVLGYCVLLLHYFYFV